MKTKKAKIKKCAFGLNTNTSLPFHAPGRIETIGDSLTQANLMQQQANYEGDKLTLPMHAINGFIASMLSNLDFNQQIPQEDIIRGNIKGNKKTLNNVASRPLVINNDPLSGLTEKRINLPSFAFGGTVPVEAEGGEIIETPNGMVSQLKGPSHENGGIDLNIPQNSDIYSKRIKIDGKTIAQRKKSRELEKNRLEKKLSESKDPLLRKTLDRILEQHAIEEEVEKTIQNSLNRNTQKADYGYTGEDDPLSFFYRKNPIDRLDFTNILKEEIPFLKLTDAFNTMPIEKPRLENVPSKPWNTSSLEEKKVTLPNTDSPKENKLKDFFTKNAAGLPTAGDLAGIGGNIYQGLNSLLSAERNAATDMPNENPFLNYGKESMKELEKTENYLGAMASNQERDLKSARNAAIVRNRRSSRDLNTMRMGDYAVDRTFNDAKNQLDNSVLGQYMQLANQKANLQQQIDQIVMGGEAQKDLANRQDKDARDTAIALGKKDMGKMISLTGKQFNDIKERLVQAKYLNQALNFLQTNVMTGDIEKDPSKAGNVYAGFQGGQRLNDMLALLLGWNPYFKQHYNPTNQHSKHN